MRVPAAFGSVAKRKGFRKPHANVSWQRLPGVVSPATLQRAVPAPWNGFDGGIPSVPGDPEELAQEVELVARGVVRPAAAAVAGVVGPAVAGRDVEVPVAAEAKVARVVVAAERADVVDEDDLRRRVDDVRVGKDEARDPVARPVAPGGAGAGDVPRVEEVDVPVRRERRVDGHAEEPALGVRADLRDGEGQGRRRQERPRRRHDPEAPALAGHEEAPVGRERHGRGPSHARRRARPRSRTGRRAGPPRGRRQRRGGGGRTSRRESGVESPSGRPSGRLRGPTVRAGR